MWFIGAKGGSYQSSLVDAVIYQPLIFGCLSQVERKQDRLKKFINIYTPLLGCFNNNSPLISSAADHFNKWRYFLFHGPKNCVPRKPED